MACYRRQPRAISWPYRVRLLQSVMLANGTEGNICLSFHVSQSSFHTTYWVCPHTYTHKHMHTINYVLTYAQRQTSAHSLTHRSRSAWLYSRACAQAHSWIESHKLIYGESTNTRKCTQRHTHTHTTETHSHAHRNTHSVIAHNCFMLSVCFGNLASQFAVKVLIAALTLLFINNNMK